MKVGSFVRVDSSELGLGKLVRLEKTLAEVSYFSSPAQGEACRESVEPSRLRFESLQAQTRVYWYDSGCSAWLVGRVAEDGRIDGRDLGYDEDHYLIQLPNKQLARVAASALQVRWDRPVDDPVAYLAARTTETPYWHFGRQKFLRQVVKQRALCGSLTGLWSATLDLQLHQFRAVRTVLTDPVQRYLLADEVGLGKTIEAGAILRQYVLDEPNAHRAMIITPQHLVGQWTDELKFRFYLGPYLGRSVHVISAADVSAIRGAVHDLGILIVDEAHHPASMAFSPDADLRRRYVELAGLARRTPRLLLLSGTPVLRNEDGFLAMLHLLEPEAYPLEDREAFRNRVQNRQKIAESMSDLQPDSPSMFVEDALNTLERMTRGDARAGILIARVRDRIDADDNNPERHDAIRDLREHIGEVYRLHRRLVRHRRETVTDVLRGRAGATVVPVHDPIRRRLAELLELWREHANLHSRPLANGKFFAARLYWLLLQAAASHPAVLRELVAARRFNREPSLELTPSSREDFGLLHTAEAFPQEREILDELLAADGKDGDPRVEAVVDVVRAGQARSLKTVLFVDAPGVADYVANVLGPWLSGSVLRHAPGSSLEPFCDPEGSASVLVCDRRAEEGLNLQTVRAQIVHLDLPFDPGRIEQRIGRVDRFGARIAAASIVFADEDPLAEAWRRCLQEVVRVFDRSVASLQYVLEEHLRGLRETLFEGGVEAIDDFIAQLKDGDVGLEAELKRIHTQEQLDSIAEASEVEEMQFETLEEFDLEDDDFRDGFDGWVMQRLHFRRVQEEQDRSVVRYSYVLGGGGPQTLLPPDQFLRWCGASVDTEAGPRARATHRLAFSRNQCLRKRAELARIGHPFVDGLVELARRDDRGVAHAMWRLRPALRLPFDPWLVFGFDYVIEADPDVAKVPETTASGIGFAAIRRRLDWVLPPRYATIWVDQELEPVDDPTMLAVLEQPYDDRRTSGRGDWNLSAARWGVVRPILHVGAWDQLCFEAADRALAVLKERLSLDEELRRAEQRIDERLARVRAQLNARFSRLAAPGAAAERSVLAIEELLAEGARRAIRAPRVTPDSAFAMFLSTFDPFAESAR